LRANLSLVFFSNPLISVPGTQDQYWWQCWHIQSIKLTLYSSVYGYRIISVDQPHEWWGGAICGDTADCAAQWGLWRHRSCAGCSGCSWWRTRASEKGLHMSMGIPKKKLKLFRVWDLYVCI